MAYDKVVDSAKLDAELKKIADVLEDKGICPSAINCTLNTETGSNGFYDVINAVTKRSSSDLTASGPTVTVPPGYYPQQAGKSVNSGQVMEYLSITNSIKPSLSYNEGVITASTSVLIDAEPIEASGYISTGHELTIHGSNSNTITDSNLIPANVKSGVSIFGVTGNYEGGAVGSKNFIPYNPKLTRESSDYAGGTVTYRFQETDDGWWESSNKKVKSSYSLGRFSFDVYETCNVTFEVINYAESNYDFAIFSNLGLNGGAYFTANASADTSNVYKSFKGLSSSSIQELTYSNVTPGRYTVAVKFIKDSSGDNYNDSVKFRLKRPTPNSELLPQVESLEPTYQSRGANEPSSKYVVNYYGGNYAQIYRNVVDGGWVPDGTSFFGSDYIYFDKIDTSYSGLLPENIVAGKTVFGVTGTGGGLAKTGHISLTKGTTQSISIPNIYYSYGVYGASTYLIEDANQQHKVTIDLTNTKTNGTFSIKANNYTCTNLGLVIMYYKNMTETTFAYYTITIT